MCHTRSIVALTQFFPLFVAPFLRRRSWAAPSSSSQFASSVRRWGIVRDMSGSGTSATTTTPEHGVVSGSTNAPPVPKREEDRVVYVGAAPPGWKASLPRQSESSTEKLVDPPVALPDPYGWLRDEKRENKQVLDHLHAENAYTQVCVCICMLCPAFSF